MRFPLSLTADMAGYMVKKKIRGEKKYPLVLMLEPLHACNLTCTGCGRIREYDTTIKEKMSLQECMDAVEEAGTPIVSICGGEPLLLQCPPRRSRSDARSGRGEEGRLRGGRRRHQGRQSGGLSRLHEYHG